MNGCRDLVLPLSRHRLWFEAEARGRWPGHPGSAWRGSFGHSLKRVVCVMRLRPCPDCPLEQSCVYPTVFETGPGPAAAKMRRYQRVPQPYVLQPHGRPVILEPGTVVSLDVTLVGRAPRHVAYVVRALEEAGAGGVGPDRTALRLAAVAPIAVDRPPWASSEEDLRPGLVAEAAAPLVPGCPDRVWIEIATPLRLQRDGRLVGPAGFTPGDMLRALVRRVSMLTSLFTDAPLETDFRTLKAMANAVPLAHAELRWVEITRRSSRQQTVMRMGGIVGRFQIPLRGAEELWPFLWLGQWIGAGKGATMGLCSSRRGS